MSEYTEKIENILKQLQIEIRKQAKQEVFDDLETSWVKNVNTKTKLKDIWDTYEKVRNKHLEG